jgi:GNAT superfamily N-acetyltransferase
MREVVLARGRRPVCVPERRLPGIIAGSGGTVVEVREVSAEEEVRAVSPVVRQLRTHLSEEELVSAVERMRPEGYRLAAAYDEEGNLVGVAGFRIQEFLAYEKILYVDDLVTAEDTRSGGVGKALLDWLEGEARGTDCVSLHLDSGVQRARAHRFYFREGMAIRNFHFAKDL